MKRRLLKIQVVFTMSQHLKSKPTSRQHESVRLKVMPNFNLSALMEQDFLIIAFVEKTPMLMAFLLENSL